VVDMSSAGISKPPRINGIRCKAYPNPVSDEFTIEINLESSAANNFLEILDASGKRFLQQSLGPLSTGTSSISLDACNWPCGSYFCILYSDQNHYAIRVSVISNR
jgi:hypothetical protein